MTTTKTPTAASMLVPIDSLHDDERNVRTKLGDLTGLTASIEAFGVLSPLLVIPNADGYAVIAGKRRLAAARKAGLDAVPCIVRQDLDVAAITAIENLQRADFTAAEEAAAYQQLALAGLDAATIASTLGVALDRVGRGVSVAESKAATAVSAKYDLTLDQAAAIAEFDDDKEAVKRLTVCAVDQPSQFEHLASRMRQERERTRKFDEAVAKLTDQGVRAITTHVYNWTDTSQPIFVSALVGKTAGKKMTPAQHKECPGHCATVSVDWNGRVEIEYLCDQAREQGHMVLNPRSGSSAPKMTAMSDDAKAERKLIIENNKAWRAAEPVRRAFVAALVSRKTAPKEVLLYVTEQALCDPGVFEAATDDLLTELTNVEATDGWHWSYGRLVGPRVLERTTSAQLPLALLAQVAAGVERSIGVHTWRNGAGGSSRAARYFAFLADVGYGLSDIEQLVVDNAKKD